MPLSDHDVDRIANAVRKTYSEVWDSGEVDVFKPPPGQATTANPTWKIRSEIEWLVENVDAIRKAIEKA